MGDHAHELFESALSSAKASISVILVLFYGFCIRKFGFVTDAAESSISKLGTTILLPALLFSEIGPLATMDNIKTYGIIIPISLCFQIISLIVGQLSMKLGMPQHFVPMFVFNNVTSLPLLLLHTLSQTGSLDSLIRPGEPIAEVLSRGRVYILINALVGNLTRFALGPYLMNFAPKTGHIRLPSDSHAPGAFPSEPSTSPPPSLSSRILSALGRSLGKVGHVGKAILNPPLLGGIAACFFGLIPWFHRQLFDQEGWLSPIADSITNVGNLYTVLQMFILGAHLYSKKGVSTPLIVLFWLFLYRFFIAPAISISVIYGLRMKWPSLVTPDPVLDFVLMLSNVGPPALTLSAIAEMADLSPRVEGQIARTLTASYMVTPLIALSVTVALEVVERSGVGWP